jgi:hypothetical protein
LLKLPEFWLLWGLDLIIVGVALMWKNHIGLMGLEPATTANLVMVWIGLNALSRFIIGYVSDWYELPRVVLL